MYKQKQTKKETKMKMIQSLSAVANLKEGGRANGVMAYGKQFGWSKPSSIEGMTWRDHMFSFAMSWFGTKDINVWAKADKDSMNEFAKLLSDRQGNLYYSRRAVRQQIRFAQQALQGKASSKRINQTLAAYASAVRLNLYISK
jgi:hypothetical protein